MLRKIEPLTNAQSIYIGIMSNLYYTCIEEKGKGFQNKDNVRLVEMSLENCRVQVWAPYYLVPYFEP